MNWNFPAACQGDLLEIVIFVPRGGHIKDYKE
jgi:hypothetical protein